MTNNHTNQDDALDLAERLIATLGRHPNDAEGHAKVRDVLAALDQAEAATPMERYRWIDLPEPTDRPWVVTDWLPSGAVTLLSGSGGVGKSSLAIQLAAAVAGDAGDAQWGGPPLDRRMMGGQAVEFVSWEDQPGDLTRKLARLSGNSRSWVTPDMPVFINGDPKLGMAGRGPLWEAPGRLQPGALTTVANRVLAAAEEDNAALLVLDSAAACYADNENDRAAVRRFLSSLSEWAVRRDCAVLLLAHPPKGGAEYSGSTDWQAGCRALWTLSKARWGQRPKRGEEDLRPESWRLECLKSNYAEGGPPPALRLEWEGPALAVVGPWDSTTDGYSGTNGYYGRSTESVGGSDWETQGLEI